MDQTAKAAYVISQSVGALIEALGMEAENQQRRIQGQSQAFMYDNFCQLILAYGIDQNRVLGSLKN